LINSAFNVCPFQLQIEDHNFTVVATELSFIESVQADTLNFLSGERFDIVVNANRRSKDYLIRIRQLAPCWKTIDGFAILRYQNDVVDNHNRVTFDDFKFPTYEDEYPKKQIFNTLKPEDGHVSLTDTKSFDADESLLSNEPDHKFHLVFDSPAIKNDIMYARNNLHNFICEFLLTPANTLSNF
jgi:FtsP/CotA-like multicopper oxidase with cupredoxin domain